VRCRFIQGKTGRILVEPGLILVRSIFARLLLQSCGEPPMPLHQTGRRFSSASKVRESKFPKQCCWMNLYGCQNFSFRRTSRRISVGQGRRFHRLKLGEPHEFRVFARPPARGSVRVAKLGWCQCQGDEVGAILAPRMALGECSNLVERVAAIIRAVSVQTENARDRICVIPGRRKARGIRADDWIRSISLPRHGSG